VSSRVFVESTLQSFAKALSRALLAERAAHEKGLLQRLDPRVRLIGMLGLVVAVTLCRRLEVIAALFLAAIGLAVLSKISLWSLCKRVWLVVLGFTGLIALPALFLTPGETWKVVPWLHLTVTKTGLHSALLLLLRVETAATLTTTLVLCTPWTHILKALRSLRLSPEIVTMLAMTHRYAFLLIETANQMFESRQSRTVGVLPSAERRRMAARTAGVLLSKSVELSQEVYLAMMSRGFRGEIRLLAEFQMTPLDYAGLAAFLASSVLVVWLGR
jgi:cobalt/nickel transport system permease protein